MRSLEEDEKPNEIGTDNLFLITSGHVFIKSHLDFTKVSELRG